MSKSIICVDGNSIINRAYYGIRPLSTQDGRQTNAVYGVITMLHRLVEDIQPEYMVVCFDVHAKTFRHKAYEDYKAGRHETPSELLEQFEPTKECLKALGAVCVEKPGYEADDLIGTYAKMANDNGISAYVVTGDRDSLQLISDNTTVVLATNGDNIYYNRQKFFDKYTIYPEQFVDLKALMGDPSDNIPGVAGIGEKTATKLICEFGSLDNLYDHFEESETLRDSVKDKIRAGKESAYFSQFLSRIVCDVPDVPSLDEVKKQQINKLELKALFIDLEFTKLIRTFKLNDVSEGDDDSKVKISAKHAGIDELTRNDYCVYIDYDKDCVYYGTDSEVLRIDDIISQKAILDNIDNNFAMWDVKDDYHESKKYGIKLLSVKDDIKLMGYVVNSLNNISSLERTAIRELGIDVNSPESIIVSMYKLRDLFNRQLKETNQYNVYRDIDFPLAHVLYEMEDTGFKVDIDKLRQLSDELGTRQRELEERIYMYAGMHFNINSPLQLGKVLFETLSLPKGKKTTRGYKTDAETLEDIRNAHPIVDDILDYRTNAKFKATYADGLLEQADENEVVHTCFKQALTATGRLSSTDPNLQNIPIKTELGRNFRACFITRDKDNVLIDADYSQIELRVLAALSNDDTMIHAFKTGADIHTSTAMKIFKVSADEVEIDMRKKAKTINFGILYGMGDYTLANDLHTSRRQAASYIDEYLKTYPNIKAYLENIVEEAKQNKFVKTYFGRRRYIPEISSNNKNEQASGARIAKNSPIQGTAADIIKIAMLNTDKKLKEEKLDAKLVLQIHDELIIECKNDCKEKVMEILKTEMENAVNMNVPFTVEINSGSNWLEVH